LPVYAESLYTLTPSSEQQGEFLVDSAEDHDEDEIEDGGGHGSDGRRLITYNAASAALQRNRNCDAVHDHRHDGYQNDNDLQTHTHA